MRFQSREAAARQLAEKLASYRGCNPLVLAIPRGAVVMARIIADALQGEADVVLVRKLRAPTQPELALGAIDEYGHVLLAGYVRPAHVSDTYLEQEKHSQLDALKRRRTAYGRLAADPQGRVVIVVDDGVATGSTMIAALKSIRLARPTKLVAAMAVAPPDTVERLYEFADDVVCLATPIDFRAVGQFFHDFRQVSDEEVVALLKREAATVPWPASDLDVAIRVNGQTLSGHLTCPPDARGIVLFAHGSGSSRSSPRNLHVARQLNQQGIATLLFDLLTPDEDRVQRNRFNVGLLADRLVAVTNWIAAQPETKRMPIAYFGASTGAGAAMIAASKLRNKIACIVSRGGRADLALDFARRVNAPTLLIVGGEDPLVLELNRNVFDVLPGAKELSIVPGASHLFEEPGALDEVTRLAAEWFLDHLARRVIPASHVQLGGVHHVTAR